ncbi:MAG TPA: HU family DNA-binding protein [Candidatus Pacearchaeota archaeon]|jgi:DNA-binding protein HU-beta|nr:HU family DNA-binding protein [Candidatus Pacearchaeota archaeon]HRR94992.1 HU family DNA-binding protein [Candidatus Paceibacterota bacterium]HPC30665.1 HU family DNA-binding protein [Candidatus Pacearchaeota archaeon]HQG09462.1 HU family DNA-binding protein [Candidatus Pacearchaeota archaeon]HQH20425.1 HU family DNA-binding protein [Candidatus Pacearchaeota archaeon]
MTKDDIIEAIVQKTAMAKKDAAEAVNTVLEEITKTLSKGGEVVLTGFGTFKVNRRAAREGRNPKTGEKLQIPATNVPKFKPGKGLKDAVK